jgi:predicted RNase H-like nuclease
MKYIGVDACAGGWFAVSGDGDGRWRTAVHADFASVWQAHGDAVALFVDIPVGLPDRGVRLADGLCRQRLGARKASVFSVPVRGAAQAMATTTGADGGPSLTRRKDVAKTLNRQLSGKSLSEQSLGIVPKILDVDSLLAAVPAMRGRVFEAHPELCFALAGGGPMHYPKKDFLGGLERLRIVEWFIPEAAALLADVRALHPRSVVDGDDMLDAMILAASAWCSRGRPTPMPDPPEIDGSGLSMAIWYHDFNTHRG